MVKLGCPIGLYHPIDGITNPKYNLLGILTTKYTYKEKKAQNLTGIGAAIYRSVYGWFSSVKKKKKQQKMLYSLSSSTL
jgi:hypothetical protein